MRGDDPKLGNAVKYRLNLSPHAWDVPYIFVLCFNTSGPQAYSSRTHFLIIWRKFLSFAHFGVFIHSPFLYFSTAFLLYA